MRDAHARRGMRPLRDLIGVNEAHALLEGGVRPVDDVERVDLVDALGRILATPVFSPRNVPGFDRAAMDGYAFRYPASRGPDAPPMRFKLVGVVHAGDSTTQPLGEAECAQVATGAPLPAAADTVVPVERTRLSNGHVVVDGEFPIGAHVSRAGSDMRSGERIIDGGVRLSPARIAVAAGAGLSSLDVWRRPRVAIYSTGTELVAAGDEPGPAGVHDSNGPALEALLRGYGADVTQRDVVADDEDAITQAIDDSDDCDLLVFSGGSSAGERDVLRDALAAAGEILFHGVRVKPGKPMIGARIGSQLAVGLPGYPSSCLTDAYVFLVPLLALYQRGRRPEPRRVKARLSASLKGSPDREWYAPVRLQGNHAEPTFKESGHTTSLAEADGFVHIPAGSADFTKDSLVDVILLP